LGGSVLILCLLLILGLPAPLLGQASQWSPPLRLSSQDRTGWFADIAVDVTGQVHAVWSSSDDQFDLVMYDATRDGQNWPGANDIFAFEQINGGSYVSRPTLTIDAQGIMHLGVHGQGDRQYYARAPFDSAKDPAAWRSTQIDGMGYHTIPVEDSNGTLHLVYTQRVETAIGESALHPLYKQSIDDGSTWSDPIDISFGFAMGAAKPQVLLDQQGTLYVVWEAGGDGDRGYVFDPSSVMFSASYDNGTTWTAPYRLDSGAEGTALAQARNVVIGSDNAGTLIATWWSMPDNRVYYRTSADKGLSWSPVQLIPGVLGTGASSLTRQDDYAMATDSAGDVHLVVVGRQLPEQTRASVMHLVWDGSTWLRPEVLATYQNDLAEWPRIAVGLGNHLHVVWHVRPGYLDPTSTGEDFQVWYTDRIIDSPAIAPEALPAHTLVPPQTAPATANPPSAPLAVEPLAIHLDASQKRQPGILDSWQSLQGENDDVLVLIISTVPVVGLIVAGLLIARSRRRKLDAKTK